MKAPEKIYLFENTITETPDDRWLSKRSDKNDIEYIRTDAFIEKAVRWLNCRLFDRVEVVNFGTTLESIISKGEFVDNFRKYMKGE